MAVWQENLGGWEIQLASCTNDALPAGLSNAGAPISTSLSGSNLHPEVAIHGSKVHVIWKNSGTGQVMYLRGTVEGAGLVESAPTSGATLNRLGPGWVRIERAVPGANYSVLSPTGALLHKGNCDGQGEANLPSEFAKNQLLLVQVQGNSGMELLKLGTIED